MAAISTSEERDEGGDLLLWVLVWGELAAFGILLTGYVVMSMLHPESFALAKLHLAPRLAGLNTVVLLASSWQAALAASSQGKPRRQRLFLLGAALLGFLFVALKFAEYSSEWTAAGDENLQTFFELYFLITGFHLAHVAFVATLFVLAAIRLERSTIVTLTTIWHVIDIVWLVMFPLIYPS
ncbi:cytochrome c oxidase subunit 3 [Neorhizobium sp. T6_25]|uniref:cytochrome c oxidase subunit 3 n=1 Tax=Neorhizobium sp. T6_25 TaxID=2093833 RepID=UPI000CF99697|nr:cytochrome c oxidase subunit 3 [Neorhizobium sp. T6_25]